MLMMRCIDDLFGLWRRNRLCRLKDVDGKNYGEGKDLLCILGHMWRI